MCCWITSPATSNPMYPIPLGYPLPKPQPVCTLLAKTEPLELGFWFLAPTKSPLCVTKPHPSATSNLMHPTQKPAHLHFASQTRAPGAQFLVFGLNQTPFTCRQTASPCHLKPDIPHPIRVPSTQKPAGLHFASQNQAPVALFCTMSTSSLYQLHHLLLQYLAKCTTTSIDMCRFVTILTDSFLFFPHLLHPDSLTPLLTHHSHIYSTSDSSFSPFTPLWLIHPYCTFTIYMARHLPVTLAWSYSNIPEF